MWRHIPTVSRGRFVVAVEPSAAAPPEPEPPAAIPSEPAAARLSLTTPDFLGLPSMDARRLARAAGLMVTVEDRPASEEKWGRILEQDPAPGAPCPPDGIVTLTFGARARVPVPDVRGRGEDEALSMLRDAGLGAARRAARRSDRVPEGCVVRTRPRAGADVPVGSHIEYVIADAPRPREQAEHKRGRRASRAARLPDGSFLFRQAGRERRG